MPMNFRHTIALASASYGDRWAMVTLWLHNEL